MNKKEELRQAFFKEHTEKDNNGLPKIATAPHDLFEWFYKQLSINPVSDLLPLDEEIYGESIAEAKKFYDDKTLLFYAFQQGFDKATDWLTEQIKENAKGNKL